MSLKTISTEDIVIHFICELHEILNHPQFNVDTGLDILLKKKSESPIDPYTTENTLLALGFDRHDVRNQLLTLVSSDYLETFIDDKDGSSPPFYAFVKYIKGKVVYIKIKIRSKQQQRIFCVSFHFTRFPINQKLPYQKISH